jgi:hypothetical protein
MEKLGRPVELAAVTVQVKSWHGTFPVCRLTWSEALGAMLTSE